jgi:transposase
MVMILHSAAGWTAAAIARALCVSLRTASRVRARWLAEGEAGLVDRREDNGDLKATEGYAAELLRVLEKTAPEHGHRRPTWTQALLIKTMHQRTGVKVSTSTMSRLLKRLGVRRGRAKPLAPCPWSEKARGRRVGMIHRLIEALPADEAAAWEDEVDIDLNPRIGCDWTLPGRQRVVRTPGKNIKRYMAGALDAKTDRVTWVKGERKHSGLFIALLAKLLEVYADKRVIHLILDNYTIHSSKRTRAWLAEHGSKFRLHFLPPYCPDDNRIERKVWREVHANVTANHGYPTINALAAAVGRWLGQYNRQTALRKAA